MFWDIYLKLCNAIGKAPSAVAKEMGFSNAAATGWKNGAMPRSAALAKISDYFNVPVETFLEGFEVQEIGIEEETENPPPVGNGLSPALQELFDYLKDKPEEQIKQGIRVLKAMFGEQKSPRP